MAHIWHLWPRFAVLLTFAATGAYVHFRSRARLRWNRQLLDHGEAVMFDETFVHHAENQSDVQRLILFCDIDRPLSNPVAQWLNRHIGQPMARAAATQNVDGEKVGALNKAFEYIYRIRLLGQRMKAWNRTAYYLVKWGLIGGVVWAIFLR